MPLEVKKKQKETPQSLLRRFSRRIKMSGILLGARRSRFFKREKSKQLKKRKALRKNELKEEYKKAKKLGKITKKTWKGSRRK